jgi:hypothetical protein
LPKARAAWYMMLMSVCCTCLLLSNAGGASAEEVDFRDDFTTLDPHAPGPRIVASCRCFQILHPVEGNLLLADTNLVLS